jgi:hypothetical protein
MKSEKTTIPPQLPGKFLEIKHGELLENPDKFLHPLHDQIKKIKNLVSDNHHELLGNLFNRDYTDKQKIWGGVYKNFLSQILPK